MEKPKNYWVRAYVANILAILVLIYTVSNGGAGFSVLVSLFLGIITFTIGVLCITRGIESKDWYYVLFGIISLIILFSTIPVTKFMCENVFSYQQCQSNI